MAKITIKELESLTANDAGHILREDGNLAGRISVRNWMDSPAPRRQCATGAV